MDKLARLEASLVKSKRETKKAQEGLAALKKKRTSEEKNLTRKNWLRGKIILGSVVVKGLEGRF